MIENTSMVLPAAGPTEVGAKNLARRQYQKGTVELHNDQWTVRFLERVYEGSVLKTKHRRKYLGGSPPKMTEKMALRLAEPIMAEINSSTKPKHASTLNDFIVRWTELCMPKTETARNFRYAINKYLKPAFGNQMLSEIQTEDVQRFIVQVETGAPNMQNIIKVFKTIWKSAKAWGYVRHNPFEDLIIPAIEKSEQRFFSEAELCRILSAAPEPDKTMYWLLAQTGLRIGEILALTWDTVDIENGIVQVQTTVVRGKLRERKTKTEASKRVLPISPRLQEHLSIYRTKLWRANESNLLFTRETTNGPINADRFLIGHLSPLLAKLNIPPAGFHAFRHASATILSRMKVPMEIRRARMGHTDEEMTLRYTHVIEGDARNVAAGFDQFLLPEEIMMEVGA